MGLAKEMLYIWLDAGDRLRPDSVQEVEADKVEAGLS